MTPTATRSPAHDTLFGVGAVTVCALVGAALLPIAELEDVVIIHVLGVVVSAIRLPLERSMATAVALVASFDFFFVPPAWAFAWGELKHALTLLGMLVVAFVVSRLARRLRQQERLAVEARERERTQFLQAENERVRSSILSSVSHDLKTPLASIIAAGTTLSRSREQLPAHEFELLLEAIVTQSERLSRIVMNLLSITRLEAPAVELKLSAEAIDEVISAALDRLGTRLDPSRVHLDIPRDLPLVAAEPVLLEQVFCNLFENVARYCPPESAMDIEARRVQSSVRVSVLDRGPGVSPELFERVFEKFERGPSARTDDGGMGLGLTICRSIVKAHGGSIALGARPGGGTAVTLELPMHASAVAAQGVAPA
jgi:two-component system sensor histidine kinase KdpD